VTRSVPEWIGATDDAVIPPRVKVRLFEATGGCCEECRVRIRPGSGPEFDHRKPLIAGGENRETNLQVLCIPCHRAKTKADVAEKALSYRKRAKHLGVLSKGRPMPGSRSSEWKKTLSGEWVRRDR